MQPTIIIIAVLVLSCCIGLIVCLFSSTSTKSKTITDVKSGLIQWTGVPNKCMSVSGGMQSNGANGTRITLWDCPNSSSTDPNLQFKIVGNQIVWTNNGTIPNKCVSVSGGIQGSGANNTPFTLWDCPNNSSTDPNLQFKTVGNQIVWTNNGTIPDKCMSVSGGIQSNGANGTSFTLWDCPNNSSTDPNLQFKI